MCGICGSYAKKSPSDEKDRLRVAQITRALRHRGPDDEGFFHDDRISLGHRRLSIIDLSQGGQPIFNEDESCVIVFNGEIYNYQELRSDLEAKGHRFRTQSDTEVILHQYEESGPSCVTFLNGMFTFAIWDRHKKRVLLARDRLGIKPLYFYQDSRRLLFSSELRPLLRYGDIDGSIDPYSLYCLLNFQYVPAPKTIIKSIRKLPPGCLLIAQGGDIQEKRYWSISQIEPRQDWDYHQAKEELSALLRDSVQRRMISDVPLGAFLSGGVDSSTIVSLMSSYANRPIHTFSVGFSSESSGANRYNETGFARLAADHFRSEHRDLMISPTEFADALPAVWRHLDGPVTDPAIVPTYLVSKLARELVTVVLTGEGADELFGGYLRYSLDRYHAFFRLPEFMRSLIHPIWRLIPNSQRWQKGFQAVTTMDPLSRYLRWVSVFDQNFLVHALTQADVLGFFQQTVACLDQNFMDKKKGSDFSLNHTLALDLQTWLPDDLLAKVDAMSMAVSLEARVPFLDHRLVELAMAMPHNWKISGKIRKRILKDVAAPLLPKAILDRKKMGFDTPLRQWFRGPLRPLLQETLSDSELKKHGFFNTHSINGMMQRFFSGRQDFSLQLWSLFLFQNWYQDAIG
ncbi:MAG: asparagine synthase (glutamine-hydrolyzing) [Candidatus Cloacimonetes bacterium 4572_55]|nr:MAG: asparagine synthase (glutamine-hydrolyzing) [Candidatus Cloacimonetes bacterium 4572_55]